jgi:hypothetical protein
MTGRPTNVDRQNALALGLRTYTGAIHPICGTTERYTTNCGCVHCARQIATEQREALKAIKAAQERVNQTNDDHVDTSAEARYLQGIEDLM